MTKYESTLMNIGKRNQQGFDAFRNTMLEDIAVSLALIADAQTNDVREVVHGCWEYSLASDETFCSECHYVIAEGEEYPIYNFCPNCGADMRGGSYERTGID